jgi:hypothetical protein
MLKEQLERLSTAAKQGEELAAKLREYLGEKVDDTKEKVTF